MKKMFKKGLSVLLAVLMVISVVPASTLMSASASAASLGYVVGDVVEFGSYPQSKVTDSAIISELESLTLDWKSCGFMSGDGEFGSMTEGDYMKYADVELGGEKYRAVTFTQYRPNLTYQTSTEKNSNQDDNGYFTDAVYWFRFEPLKWRIIDAEAGLIMSESLIDAQPYAETVYYYDNGGSTEDDYYLDSAHRTYANNYEKASLREWLNEEFYNTAFSGDEKSKVLTYKCDNSAAVSKYDSGSTRDYVFLPSSDDVNNADMGFASDADRAAAGTDYAKALGLYTPDSGENSFWWLRTPGTYSYYACRVDNSGKTDDYGNSIDFTNYGIRPVIRYDFDGAGERYTATFMVDGEIYAQNSYAVGESIVEPEIPEKEGYTFKEWDMMIPETMGYEDMTFNATWVANSYTVTFNAGDGAFTDGDTVKTVTADYGSAVNCIDDIPLVQGYEFTGWYDESGNPVTFPVTVAGDITLTAHYAVGAFTVTYYDGDTVYTVQDYTYGDAIFAPEAPAKTGYVFKGWSMLSGGAVSDNLGTVTGNMSFYAVWSAGETSYKINIYEMNTLGMFSTKPSKTQEAYGITGTTVTVEPEELAGFTVDSRSTLTATVAADGSTVLKVYYARNQYILTVDGVEYLLYYNATVPAEVKKVPEKEGLEHIGYVDANGERVDIPAKMPAENLTLTSEWTSAYYTLTLIVDGMYNSVKYAYGDYIEAVEAPAKEGYTFAGWSETEGGEIVAIPDTMPASNLTYYAVWNKYYTVRYLDSDGEVFAEYEVLSYEKIPVPDAVPEKEFYVFVGWSIDYDTMPAADLEVVPIFERVPVKLSAKEGTEITVDHDNMAITGVPEGITESELRNALDVRGDGYIEINLTYKNKVGTGTVVSLYDNVTGDKLGDYTVVIMGDLDGDGVRTGEDAKILHDEILGNTGWSNSRYPEYNLYLFMAANVDGDRRFNANDFALLGFGTYDVNIYTMNSDGSYEETESIVGYGLAGETASFTPASAEEGFYIDTEKSVLSGTVSATEQLTLSVYYAREQYTIIYSIDGYEIEHKYNYGAPIDIPAEPVKEGYTFNAWTPVIPETMPAQDLYFEAVYEINMYTLTFDANGGLFADGSSNIVKYPLYDYGIEAPADPEREGYVFSGWDDWVPMFMPAEDLTFTAVWSPATDTPYVVETYFMDTAGEYGDVTITYFTGTTDDVITLTPEELDGFTFDAEKSVISGTVAADGSTVLKVYYSRNLHTVTFTVDGEVYDESVYYYDSTLVEPVNPSKENFVFAGWVDADGNPAVFPKTVEGDLTFAAVFQETCEYTITFNANGGDFEDGTTIKTVKAQAGESVDFGLQLIREAYIFAGWQDENGNYVSLPITMPAEDIELFAVWNQDLCFCRIQNVTLITDSYKQQNLLYEIMVKESPEKVEFLENNSEVYTSTVVFDRNEAFVPDDLTEIGIISIRCVDYETGEEISDESGYFYDNYCEVWTVVASLPEGEYKVRAKVDALDNSWEAVDYSYDYWLEYEDVNFDLQLDANGGYFTKNATNHIIVPNMCYGESIADYYEEPVRDGYKFMGWEDDSHNIVEINGTMPDVNGTLYAIWEELSSVYDHTITFDADGGYFEDGSDVYTVYADYDDVLQYPPEPYKEGYTFMGWYPYVSDVVEGDATYTATWEVNEYTATYYVDGEVYEAYPIYYGDEVDMPADPYIEGKTFVGWSPDVPATMPAMDLEFHAVFEAELITGTCGDNLTWTFNESTGELVISGEGAMSDYAMPGEEYASIINTVYIDDGVTSICDWAFSGFDSLTSVKIGNSVISIGDWAFSVCPSLTSVAIGDSVTSIGDYAFEYCNSLSSITVGSANTAYSNDEYGVLLNKDKTELIHYPIGNTRASYVIPDSVTSIGERAFHSCDILTSVTIPDSVISIGGFAFEYCNSLISVTIGNGVTSIGDRAFHDCGSLTSVSIGNSVTSIGDYAFSGCISLTSVKIGNSVTNIGDSAFRDCYSITSVTIPDSVTSIGDYAFCDCTSLSSITIGNGATYIGDSAFQRCTSLSDVYYTGTEKDWNAITIGLGNDLLTRATIHFGSTGPAALNITTPEANLASSGTNAVTGSGIISLSDADVSLEFTEAYYVGEQIFPAVYLQYGDELFDANKELEDFWIGNDKVGTATVALEGLNRFSGGVSLEFTISYEEIPEQIVNATAVGDIGKILLSWGISSEVGTSKYNIYRRDEGSDEYTLIKTVNGRENLSYTDSAVEEGKTYIYYITGVGTYGAESLPSAEIYATVQSDKEGPTVFKLKPASNSTLYATQTLSINAEDNIGIAKAVYSYSEDNGATWNVIGEATGSGFACKFDTTVLSGTSVSVKVVAYDAAGNASDEVINTYKVDNIGPEKVTGLSAAVQSSIITLSWNNVADADANYFILQQKINGTWTTVQTNLKTRGANVENLQAETDYTFRVACVDIRGNVGEFSDEFTVATGVDTMIPAITGQSPSPARYRSAFTYTATAQDECGIKSIKVQVSYDEESWTDIGTKTFSDAAQIQSYSIKINTDEYNEGYLYVRAIATDISGNESISDESAPYYIDRTAPDAPTGLKASGQDGYVSLEWTVGTENDLGGYYVYRATEENGDYTAIMSNRAVYNYPDQTVERGKTYYYKIRVSDTCGNMSDYSAVVSAKMLDDTIKPVVRSIGETYNNSLSKSYNTFNVVASDNNMLSYMVVEYCTTKNMTYTEAARAESIADAYKNISVKIPMDGLESGDKVYVRAYAVDVMGLKSDYVNAQYTVDLTAPSASDFKASIANDKVTLTWNDCGEADLAGFKVYRSENGKDYTLIGSRSASSSGTYSFSDTVPSSESKTYYYKVEALDSLANALSVVESVEYFTSADDGINTAPVADISCKSYMILNVEEEFDASASTDDIEITEYIWNFGDGTSSIETRPVKKYAAVGTYEVTLTVKDAEGLQHSVTKTIEVKEREKLGTLKVRVVDENGRTMPYVPVHFAMYTDKVTSVKADSEGIATMDMAEGTYTVGTMSMKVDGKEYLPSKKTVAVLPNATRTVTLTMFEGDVVVGEFEIKRLDTIAEIEAAGIDPYSIDNSHIIESTVRLTYGSTPVKVNYYNDGNKVIKYTVSDYDGNDTGGVISTPGGDRKIVNITYLGNDTVAFLDVPARTQFLKEMFEVRLHITNNASTDFILKQSEVVLNLPESGGLKLMTDVADGYERSLAAQIDSIRGQSTVTVTWALSGEIAGDYDLTADFSGIFEEFGSDGWIRETFKTEEPIKVYGLEGVKFRILGADEIHNDTLYFNIELENERPVDLLMPDISVVNSKVLNVTDKVLGTGDAVFESTAYLQNIYVQLGNGRKQYLPIVYGQNGNLTANLEVLAPGQKLVHEYVAYNAINYDGIAYFKDAAILEFEGLLENIEVGSFKKERYSFIDYSEKLGNILSSGDPEVAAAWNYIDTDSNYYYVDEANQGGTLRFLYNLANTVINADPSGFADGDMKDKAKEILLSVLTDESVLGKIDELTGQKYYYAINSYLADAKAALMVRHDKAEVESAFEELYARIDWLTEKYVIEGSIAFYDGVTSIIDNHLTSASIEVLQFTPMDHFGKVLDDTLAWSDTILDALTSVQKDVYIQGVLKFESNVEYSNFILDAILMASEALDDDISSAIVSIVKEFKEEINESVKQYRSKVAEIAQYAATEVTFHLVGQKINEFVGNCIGSSVMSVVKVVFNFAMWAFGVDDYMKQKAVLRAYDQIGDAFLDGFARSSSVTNTVDDFYYLTLLRAGCETRLGGEATYKQFILDYIGGKNLDPVEEAEALDAINDVMGTSYSSIDAWYDVVQYEIVSSRDILFNIEFTETNIPSAPSVTLDYENCQTVQSFGDDYEYCFGDGVWKSCNGKPVKFELDTVPQTLRVRVAASDSNLAGEITTVRIYAQKELSKLINVKYDSGKYIFGNLTSERTYEAVLLNTSISSPDWSEAMYVSGGEISCDAESNYIALRSRPNANLLETYSLSLVLKVQKKQLLDLEIEGDGTVEQSNASGEYFVGDTVDLIATPHTGCEFLGWYVDGELVSRDVHYILEYADGVKVKAEFTGVTVKSIEIESMPSKIVYTVGETLSTEGMTLKVKYSDFSTKTIDSGFTCSESVLAKEGETTVTVTYGGATTEFTVNVYKEYYILTWVVEGESVDFEMKYGEALEFDINIDRPGYEFTGWTPEVPATMPALDLTLTATFKPIAYDAIFDANGGVFADGSADMTVSVDYDAKIPAPVAPEKQGYLFAGWSYNGVIFGENLGTMRDVNGMIFKAEWIAATDTVYKIETYTMDTAGEYVLSTQLLSGTTGENVTAEPVIDEGFVLNAENSVLSGVIAGDDSLVLKVYIDRLTYTLTVDNGTETVSDTYYYGAMIAPAEAPAKTGYTFKGWDSEFPETMPAKDMTITAIFEANTYDAVFMNGSEIFKTVNIIFGEKIEAPAEIPEKENYNFIGWSLDGTIILTELGVMNETGKIFYAVWQAYTPDHEHIPHTVTIDATCTVEGMEYTICLECGETIGEAVVLPALNHSETQTVTVESTCTVPGMQYEICIFCGETIGDAVVLPLREHTAGEWETVTEATCVESGEKLKKCSACGEILENGEIEALGHNWGEWETVKEADCVNNGEQKRTCTRDSSHAETVIVPALGHKVGDWETSKAATCTEKGEQLKKCTACSEVLETKSLNATGHSPASEWTVILAPTAQAEGKKIKKCLVCGKAAEELAISKLEVAHHEDTDVAIEYQPDDYDGDVSINVEETFDGGAFNVVNTQTGSAKTQIYDITMTVDGKETQPEGKVTVRIPLPEGYNPNRSFVYHIDTKTGKAVKMNTRYENGYLVFETDHFSYYAVVDESQAGTAVNATLSIKQPSITTVKYGDTLILHAEIKGEIPDGARLEWSVEGEGMTIKAAADGMTCAVTSTAKGEVTVKVKLVDKNGNALSTSDGAEITAQQKLTSKAGFFQKLISFFKNLFRMNRIIEQAVKSFF